MRRRVTHITCLVCGADVEAPPDVWVRDEETYQVVEARLQPLQAAIEAECLALQSGRHEGYPADWSPVMGVDG